MELIAKKSLRYAGQSLEVGDKFEASEKDARILKAVGRAGEPEEEARIVDVETPVAASPVKNKYQTRRMKAADGAKDAKTGADDTNDSHLIED